MRSFTCLYRRVSGASWTLHWSTLSPSASQGFLSFYPSYVVPRYWSTMSVVFTVPHFLQTPPHRLPPPPLLRPLSVASRPYPDVLGRALAVLGHARRLRVAAALGRRPSSSGRLRRTADLAARSSRRRPGRGAGRAAQHMPHYQIRTASRRHTEKMSCIRSLWDWQVAHQAEHLIRLIMETSRVDKAEVYALPSEV